MNPLLQKYDELYGQKEEPKPSSPPRYSKEAWAISQFEGLLEELKTGKAVFLNSKRDPNYRYYDPGEDFKLYMNGSNLEPQMPLRIDEGDKITLTIFRKRR
jgi:hypothetical protein